MERSLPSRKRQKPDPGKPIRVSRLVFTELNKGRGKQSWDCFMRSMLGLPNRKGKLPNLVEGVLEVHSGIMILKMPETSWKNIEELAKKLATKNIAGRNINPQPPIRMREIR